MNRGNFFRRTLLTLLTVSIMLFASVTHAEIYTGEGSYIMSEGENLGVAKERAKADAMRNAAEKAGTYVKSYSRARNFELEEDIIETMTANILKLVENPHFYPIETVDNLEGVMIRVTVKVKIDDSDINSWLNKSEQEKSLLVAQMENLRKANAEQERQIAELKRQLTKSNKKEEKERITQEFANEDKIFLSNQKVEEAFKLYNKYDSSGYINLLNEAIQLNPNNDIAYNNRGVAYAELGRYEQAIQDFNKAIQLNPNYDATAYANRGLAYHDLGQNERAIQDLNKAISINPNDGAAYNGRGLAYSGLEQYERAIQDYNKAIQLNPNDDMAYNNRGGAYRHLKQYDRAIQDYSKSIELDPNDYGAYYNRGWIYGSIGQYSKGILDATKAIQLNPNHFNSYVVRSFCYQQLGEMAKARADLAKAKELGYNC